MFTLLWSPVNRAWFVMFGDSVLRVFNDRADAEWYLSDICGVSR